MPRKSTKQKKSSRRELDREAEKLSDMELVDESLKADRALEAACQGPLTNDDADSMIDTVDADEMVEDE